jgi:hypothetical protein
VIVCRPAWIWARLGAGSGTITTVADQVTVRVDRRAYPSCARPAFRPTPPSPGGRADASTSSSANSGSKKLHGNPR